MSQCLPASCCHLCNLQCCHSSCNAELTTWASGHCYENLARLKGSKGKICNQTHSTVSPSKSVQAHSLTHTERGGREREQESTYRVIWTGCQLLVAAGTYLAASLRSMWVIHTLVHADKVAQNSKYSIFFFFTHCILQTQRNAKLLNLHSMEHSHAVVPIFDAEE